MELVKFAREGVKVKHIKDILDDMIYLNYRFNRESNPDISVERWKGIYGDRVDTYEVWYQADTIVGKPI
jgi:hypothetical protein